MSGAETARRPIVQRRNGLPYKTYGRLPAFAYDANLVLLLEGFNYESFIGGLLIARRIPMAFVGELCLGINFVMEALPMCVLE